MVCCGAPWALKTFWQVSITVLVVVFGICAAVPFMNLIFTSMLTVAIAITLIWFRCCPKQADNVLSDDLLEGSSSSSTAQSVNSSLTEEIETGQQPKPQQRKRLYYLDNLKSVLTAIVILHHSAGAFGGSGSFSYMIGNYGSVFSSVFSIGILGINQSYFMCLFFFISGYFTPTSRDRKGTRAFLKDKFTRLGIPFLVYTIVIGPLLYAFTDSQRGQEVTYTANPGQTWFVLWLLGLNCAYCLIGGESAEGKYPAPSLKFLLLISLPLGLLQGGLLLGTGNFLSMPITWGSLPFDILYFSGGVLAKRNHWLDSEQGMHMGSGEILVAKALVVLLSIAVFVVMGLGYSVATQEANRGGSLYNLIGILVPLNDCTSGDVFVPRPEAAAPAVVVLLEGLCVFMGVLGMAITVAMLAVFQKHWNFASAATRFFSDAAYAVYIVHSVVVAAMTRICVYVLERIHSDVDVRFTSGSPASSQSCLGGEASHWLGFLLTSVAIQLVVWPMGAALRKLPGFRHVL